MARRQSRSVRGAAARPATSARASRARYRWRCSACRSDFSLTSGTLFAWHKLPLRTYLLAVAVFCNEVKGKSMLALARELDVQYQDQRSCSRTSCARRWPSDVKVLRIGGEGRRAEIDGASFGGHVRPENLAADRVDRRLAGNQSSKRKVVVVLRERGGNTLVQVAASEEDAVPTIRQRIIRGPSGACRREPGLEPAARQFRYATHQPPGRLLRRRRLHQRGGGLLLPPAPGRVGAPSSHRRPLSPAVHPGGGLARGCPSRQQRGSGAWRCPSGAAIPTIGRFLRLLAACTGFNIGTLRCLIRRTASRTRRLTTARKAELIGSSPLRWIKNVTISSVVRSLPSA